MIRLELLTRDGDESDEQIESLPAMPYPSLQNERTRVRQEWVSIGRGHEFVINAIRDSQVGGE